MFCAALPVECRARHLGDVIKFRLELYGTIRFIMLSIILEEMNREFQEKMHLKRLSPAVSATYLSDYT